MNLDTEITEFEELEAQKLVPKISLGSRKRLLTPPENQTQYPKLKKRKLLQSSMPVIPSIQIKPKEERQTLLPVGLLPKNTPKIFENCIFDGI